MADDTTMDLDHPLPSSKELITSIISELASYRPAIGPETGRPTPSKITTATATNTLKPAQNRLAKLPEVELSRVKPLLLTLHCLFTNEFLLALDILDRRLVRKLVVDSKDGLKKGESLLSIIIACFAYFSPNKGRRKVIRRSRRES